MRKLYYNIYKVLPIRKGMTAVLPFVVFLCASVLLGGGLKAQTYCTPTLSSTTTSYYISNFTTTGGTANINNSTSGSGSSYSDFYNSYSASADPGATISFTITIAGGGTHGTAIWVDWNNDGTFDSDERVWNTTGYLSSPHTGSFTVPANASGTHRMRVVSDWLGSNPSDPCAASTGEFEDYKLIVASASCDETINMANMTRTIQCGGTYCFYDSGGSSGSYSNSETYTATFTSEGSITLTFSSFNTESSYDELTVYDGSTSGSVLLDAVSGTSIPSTVTAASGTMTVVWSSDGTVYRDGWSAVITSSCGPCTPTLTSTTTTYYISRFATTGAITNIGNSTTGAGHSYSDFYNTYAATASAGSTISFTITIAGGGTHGSAIWVDWNRNGEFESSERVYNTTGYASSPHSGSFTIPANASGDYRMRVVSDYLGSNPSNPCSASTGEFEDYRLTVVGCVESVNMANGLLRTVDCGSSFCFFDSGGETGDYSNSQSMTATFRSTGRIVINFSSFATESSSGCYDWDYITIYDGTESGTMLVQGQTGCTTRTLNLNTDYVATSGTMTIVWKSDGSNTASGWKANVTAVDCGSVTPDDCVTIGNGTSCTYTYGPVNNFYRYGYYQYIYPLSSPGQISSLSYQYCYTTAMTDKTNVNIYMGQTSNSTFSSSTDWVPLSNLTLVYSGPLNCTAQGWNTFTLTTPYYYDGTGNLVIAIDDNSNEYDGSSYTFYYTSGSGNNVLYYYSDSTDPNPASPPSGTLSANCPNTRICIEDCTPRTVTFNNSNVTITSCTGTTSQTPQISLNSGGAVTWTSSNTSVATVSSSGVVTAVSTGTAVITATVAASGDYCGARGSYTVTVTGSSHRLTYNTSAACSGTASTAPASVTGTSATVTTAEPTCSSLPYFIGWNTASNGTGASYAAGSTVDLGCADVTLYARYSNQPPEITGSSDCESAMAFCASNDNTGYDLNVEPGDDSYPDGMCSFFRNATWWYLRISEAGPIEMTIESSCGDVDFGCWGPFENPTCDITNDLNDDGANGYDYYSGSSNAALHSSNTTTSPSHSTTSTAICTTGALASPCGNLVDFGGSTSEVEYLQIANAQVGQIYVVLIANYENCTGDISFTQTNMTVPNSGRSDCTIVNDCSITSVTTSIGECNADNTFDLSGNINFTDPPVDGTLTISDGSVSQVFTPPFVSPIAYYLAGIPGDNTQHTITATFVSSTTNCERITYIDAPLCETNCPDATVAMTGYDEIIDGRYYFDVCLGTGVNMSGTQTGYTSPSWRWNINPHGGVPPYTINGQNASYTPNAEQGYDVSLTVSEGDCKTVAYGRIRVSDGLDTGVSSIDIGDVCVGGSEQITVGGSGTDIQVEPSEYTVESSLGHAGTTFIPDGLSCATQCYESSVTFYDFNDGDRVTNANAIKYIRINTEHSFIGDIQIKITCPNGRSAIMLQDYYSSDTSNHALYNGNAIDPYTYVWPDRVTDTVWRIGSSSTNHYTAGFMLGRFDEYSPQNGTYTYNGNTYYLASFATAAEANYFINNFLTRYYPDRTYIIYSITDNNNNVLYYAIAYRIVDTSGTTDYFVWLTRDVTTGDDALPFSSQSAATYFLNNVYGGNGVVTYELVPTSYRRIYFGEPDIYDVIDADDLTSAEICDETNEHNIHGVGYDYAWTSSSQYTTVGHVYDIVNLMPSSTVYNNGTAGTNTLYHVIPSDVNSGSHMYEPYDNFGNLVGCPLNGTWTISVCDSWGYDNGYVFDWEIALSEDLLPSNWTYGVDLESVSDDCGSIATVTGNNLLIAPQTATNGQQTCNIILTDNLGCTTNIPLTYNAVAPTITHNSGNEIQTVCTGQAITNIVYTIGGSAENAAISWTPSTPAGVTFNVSGNTVTISGAPADADTYDYTITTVSPDGMRCTEVSETGRIQVNTGNIVPTFDQAGPYCEGTTVADLPTTSTNGITGTWSPAITNRTSTYTFTPDPGQCATITTMLITVNPLPTLEYTSGSETMCVGEVVSGTNGNSIIYTYGGGANGANVTGLPAGMEFNVNTSNNTIEISGTPTTAGTYPYVVTTTGTVAPCENISLTGTITINEPPTLTLTSGSVSQSVCAGNAITNMVYTYTNATGAEAINLPNGLTSTLNPTAHTLTISGTPTTEGTFTILTTGALSPCPSESAQGSISISDPATLSLVSESPDVVLCVEVVWTGSIQYRFGGTATGVVVDGLPDGLTSTVSGNIVTISGNVDVNAEPGDYQYTVTAVGAEAPCEDVTMSGTISVSTNATLVLTSADGTDYQSICMPGTFTTVIYTYGGAATGIDETTLANSLPQGLTAVVNTTAHTVTISGTPTETGRFVYEVSTTGVVLPCKSETALGVVEINPDVQLEVSGNVNQSFCLGNSMSDIVFTYGGGATSAIVVGDLPAGVDAVNDSNTRTLTLSGSPTESGSFSFYVTTQGAVSPCVEKTIDVSIEIYENPVVTIAPTAILVCNGSPVSMNAAPDNMSTYRWTCVTASDATYTIDPGMPTSTTTQSITVNPTVTPGSTDVVYNVRVSDANGCTATGLQRITVSQTPTANISKTDNTKCLAPYNGSIIVDGFAGGIAGSTYTVAVSGLPSQTSTGAAVSFDGLAPGTYTVTITNESTLNICITEQTITVGDNPTSPTVDISGSLSICEGTNTTLTAHASNGLPEYTYLWSDNSTNEVLVTPDLNDPTTYTITVTDANGCSVTNTVSIELGDRPEIELSATNAICIGNSSVLQAHVSNAGTGYTVTWSASTPDAGLLTTNGERITVTPTAIDTYVYTAVLSTSSCGTSGPMDIDANVSVTVNPLPSPGVNNNTGTNVITCDVEEISVTATGGVSYAWSNSVTTANNVFNSAGTYTVTVTDANGCSATTTFTVDINTTLPDVIIEENPNITELTCDNPSIELTASTTTLGTTLSWETMTVTAPDVYTVTATTTSNGCSRTASVEITSDNNAPTVSIVQPSTTTLNCTTQSITLNATGTGTMTWSPSNVASHANYPSDGVYTVTARLDNGCTTDATIQISRDVTEPVVQISPVSSLLTCSVQSVTLTASANVPVSYAWNQGPHEASFVVFEPGDYRVSATAANGCMSTATVHVNQDVTIPDVEITRNPDIDLLTCNNPTIELIANSNTAGATLSWNTQNVTEAGSYSVTVTASNGCTNTASTNIRSDFVAPQVEVTAPSTVLMCAPNDVITLTASANVGVTYDWGGGASGAQYSVTTPNVYRVTAYSNTNGCPATAEIRITQDIETPHVQIGNNSNTTVLTCNGPSISVSLIDDTEADIYEWSGGENRYGTGNAFTSGGIYYVTATAPNGCIAIDQIEITEDFSQPTVSITNNTNPETTVLTCDILEIPVTAVGSNRVLFYRWSDGTSINTANNSLTTIGTYVVTATADNGCTATATIAISETMDRPLVNINNTSGTSVFTCATTSIGVTATGTGVTYTWSGGNNPTSSTNTLTSPGTYYVTAVGANGCVNSTSITLTENLTPPSVSITNETGSSQIDCNNQQIVVTATGTGVSYMWSNNQTGATLTLTESGQYVVTATAANGCQNSALVVITEDFTPPTPVIISESNQYVINCANASTGLSLLASGGIYYRWDNGSTSPRRSITSSGEYRVTAWASNGCSAETSLVIENDMVPPDATITNITNQTNVLDCNVNSIHVIADGGYMFAWNNSLWAGGAEQTITMPGVYIVTVTGQNGCTGTASINVTADTIPPSIYDYDAPNGMELNCQESSVVLTALGNAQTYAWSGGATPSSPTNTFVVAGRYYVTATGFNGCTSTSFADIIDNHAVPQVTINNGLGNITMLDCNNPQMPITVIVSGADGPYEYSWSSNYSGDDDHGYLTTSGQYTVYVTAANHCSSAASINVQENFDPPVVNVSSTPGRELNCVTSSIELTATGGVEPYLWSNNATTSTTTVYVADTYTVTVTGANGCIGEGSIIITEAPEFSADVSAGTISCYGGTTTATVTANGGNPPYYCVWSDGQSAMTANSLVAGAYNVTVNDNGGCSTVLSLGIVQPQELRPTINVQDLNCGIAHGALTANVIGGTQPYQTYIWSNGISGITNEDLGVGTYGLTVYDANGCSAEASATVSMQGMLSVNATVTHPVTCNGSNDGSVSAICPNAAQPAVYSWNTGNISSELYDLFAGTYMVTVTDAWGCTGQAGVNLVSPPEMDVQVYSESPRCYNSTDGRIMVSAFGGMAPYDYFWSNAVSENNLNSLGQGTYSVTVSDASGCSIVRNITLEAPASISVETTVRDIKCNGDQDGRVEVSANGGVPPYRYMIEGLVDQAAASVFNNLNAGYYVLHVIDNNNCEMSEAVVVSQPEPLNFSVIAEDPFCRNSRTGKISVSVNGGVEPYLYNLNSSKSDISYMNNIPSGEYVVSVIDGNDCKSEEMMVTLTDVDVACLRIPNVFTPNGDGVNDTWLIENIEMFPAAEVHIFNRWGQLLFTSKGYTEPWDGSYRGHFVPAGTYMYIIDLFNDDEPYKGAVTIIY
ncbi:MAG: gliding motility-associated C-terminal domain-containing protein [Bacteroidales bacterium]|nr:gliding motility-associated C-terminal domain-containing protein [Bacteroidales bacterium]